MSSLKLPWYSLYVSSQLQIELNVKLKKLKISHIFSSMEPKRKYLLRLSHLLFLEICEFDTNILTFIVLSSTFINDFSTTKIVICN